VTGSASDVRVSVLVSAYNFERYIARALDSVLEQVGVEPWEVLVGDDCSTDSTRAIVRDYARRHPDVIRTVFPEKNLGGAGINMWGELLRRSRGRYLAGLDGDDYWTDPDKLRRQAVHLDEHPECSMVFHNAAYVLGDGSPGDLYNPPEQSAVLGLDELFAGCPAASCSPLFRREVISPLPSWYFRLPVGDWSLYLMAAERGEIHYLPDVMGVYRIHPGGEYSKLTPLQQKQQLVEFLDGLAGALPGLEQARRRRLGLALVDLAREHLRRGERLAAVRHLVRSYRATPPNVRLLGPGQLERTRLSLTWRASRPVTPPVAGEDIDRGGQHVSVVRGDAEEGST
jgi:glycosyltransferase involved in cell wall biosynthesis